MYHRFKWTRVSHRRNWISREYEPLQPYFLMELARTVGATTFVDVGANIGLYSVFMSQAVDRVVAYEANEALAKEIEGNFARNSIGGTVRCVAVSDTAGTVTFGIVSQYAGNSAVVEEGHQDESLSSAVLVEAVRLDDEFTDVAGPLAIKIDVEGHEPSVLHGGETLLSEKPCVIQVENFNGALDGLLAGFNLRKLTTIGPDSYFTNCRDVDALDIYQKACQSLIDANHENKSMVLRLGDVGLVISGRVYALVRGLARKVLGGRI